jgi:hypothetical protein
MPLYVESLEERSLPSVTAGPSLLPPPHDTLDQAQALGFLTSSQPLAVNGTIGREAIGGAQVDWYSFTLDSPEQVTLTVSGKGFAGVVSLYNNTPYETGDPYARLGTRLLAQDDGHTGNGGSMINRALDAGTYFIAISGAGNRYFNPFLANSGTVGQTGSYQLQLSAADLSLDPAGGPDVLASDPADGGVLDHSPLVLRIDLGESGDTSSNRDPALDPAGMIQTALDPTTVFLNQNVRLSYNPINTQDAGFQDVPLGSFNFSNEANELQLIPATPLAPGYYRLFLDGSGDYSTPDQTPLADLNGNVINSGQDVTIAFQVTGVKGNKAPHAGPHDSMATAQDLGDVTKAGPIQVQGVIGDDPYYSIQTGANRTDVDVYRFHVSGSGTYAFAAEVFAGRIGSPLVPAVTLFRFNPADHQLDYVASDDGTGNGTVSSNGKFVSLRGDSAVFAALTTGDYYLVVSSHHNVVNPVQGWQPGTTVPGMGRIFDPQLPHSSTAGTSTGDYVLNLVVRPDGAAPTVVNVNLQPGAVLSVPPTQLVVQFSGPVNVQQLAFQAFQQTKQGALAPIYIQAADGTDYYPRLTGYDNVTNQATFLMLDALPNGAYQLHLSGAAGLSDFGGNPLAGNTPGGDFVTTFVVQASPRGTNGNPQLWTDQGGNHDLADAQDLGVLFPREFVNQIVITRNANPTAPKNKADTADYYQFQVLQEQSYVFLLSDPTLELTILYPDGTPVHPLPQGNGTGWPLQLQPGIYVMQIGSWTGDQAPNVAYQVQLTMLGSPDNPVPLTSGPVTAVRLRLVGDPAPNTPAAPGGSGQSTPQVALTIPGGSSTSPQLPVTSSLTIHSAASSTATDPLALPSGFLVALSAGPVGGVTGATLSDSPSAPGRVFVRTTDTAVPAELLRLAILTQTSGVGDETAEAPEQAMNTGPQFVAPIINLLEDVLDRRTHPWQQALDSIFGGSWVGSTEVLPAVNLQPADDFLDSLEPEAAAPELLPPPESEEVPTVVALRLACATDSSWSGVLPLLAALALLPRKRRRQAPLVALAGLPEHDA